MTRKTSKKEKGITLIALIVTIIVLLILAGVTISLAVSNQGIFNKAKTATRSYKNAATAEEESLAVAENEIDKYIPKNDDSKISEGITYTDSDNKTQTLTKDTAAGTKIGTTAVDGQTLDWYLFDVSNDGKTAYLVSTPTYWVPDTTKEVSGAYPPKLVSSADSDTNALSQAIKYGTNSYTPSPNTLSYYKGVNSQWSAKRGSTAFASMNENEQAACYLADGDIFAGIKSQVNNADGNLKGKIQTLVGGASAEQWCTAYNKQAEVKNDPTKQITCEYQATNTPGYIYKVNGTAQNSGWYTNEDTIFGNDIYGAAHKNGNTSSSNAFYNNSWWWLASPSSNDSGSVCYVNGNNSNLYINTSYNYNYRVSLFASVAL